MLSEAERMALKPIFGTDFSKPTSEIVAEIRSMLTKARGQLSDVGFRYPGWGESLEHVEGLLTCGIHVLYDEIQKMKTAEDSRRTNPATL